MAQHSPRICSTVQLRSTLDSCCVSAHLADSMSCDPLIGVGPRLPLHTYCPAPNHITDHDDILTAHDVGQLVRRSALSIVTYRLSIGVVVI